MTNDDHRPGRDAAAIEAQRAATDGPLARLKRASLRQQALGAAWQLGALVRRVEREAPEMHRRVLVAVAALQQLVATSDPVPARSPRQGELF
jgi:hypothetical protein